MRGARVCISPSRLPAIFLAEFFTVREWKKGHEVVCAGMTRLHVGGLAPDVAEADLAARFAPFGEVRAVEVVRDASHACRGFAYVDLQAESSQIEKAIKVYSRSKWRGRQLTVGPAHPSFLERLQVRLRPRHLPLPHPPLPRSPPSPALGALTRPPAGRPRRAQAEWKEAEEEAEAWKLGAEQASANAAWALERSRIASLDLDEFYVRKGRDAPLIVCQPGRTNAIVREFGRTAGADSGGGRGEATGKPGEEEEEEEAVEAVVEELAPGLGGSLIGHGDPVLRGG